mmetsp:Transcript_27136/g.64901  ORF Transcript_27136/g.64901 Transcript_27136/m.64901 type:complete len:883 (+) Transcript_27136:157-2805(+)
MNENGAGGSSSSGQKNNTLSQRLEVVQKRPENGFCSECQAKKPRWAVMLSHTEDHDGLGIPCHELGIDTDTLLGMLVCISCSTVFKSLGAKSVVTVKALNHEQTCALENGGNKVINTIFEGNLTFDVERPLPGSTSDSRQTYIKAKYVDKKWFNTSAAKSALATTGIVNKTALSTKNISLRSSKNDSLSKSNHGARPSRNSNKNSALSLSLHASRGGAGGSLAGSVAAMSPKRLAASPKKLQRRRMIRQNSNHSMSGRSNSRHRKHRQGSERGGGDAGAQGYDIDFEDDSSSSDMDDDDGSFGGADDDDNGYDDELTRDLKELSRSSHDTTGGPQQQPEPPSSQKSLRSPKRDTNRKSAAARTPRQDGTTTTTTLASTADGKKVANSFDTLCFGTASDDDGFFPADTSGFGDDVGGFEVNDDPFGDSFGGESFGGDDDDDNWWGGGTGTSNKSPTNTTDDVEQSRTQPGSGVTREKLNDAPVSDVKRKDSRSKSIGRSTVRRSKSATGSMDVPVPQRRQGDLLGSSRHGSSNDLDISRSSRRNMNGSPRSPRRGFSEFDVSRSRRKGIEPPRRTNSSRSLHKLEGGSSPRSPRRTKSSISSVGDVTPTSPRRTSSSRSSRQTSTSVSRTRSSSKSRALSEQLSRDSAFLDDHIEDENKSAGGRQQSSARSRRRMGSSSSSIRSAPMLHDEPGHGHGHGPDNRRRRRRKDGLSRSSHHSSGTSLKATSAHSTSISSHDSSVSISISDDSMGEEFEASQIIQVRREDEGEEQPKTSSSSSSRRRRMRRDELALSSGHQGERSRRSTTSTLSLSRHSSHRTSKISSRSGHRTSRTSSSRSKEVGGSVTEKTDSTSASSDESPKDIRSPTKNKSITQMALSSLYSE